MLYGKILLKFIPSNSFPWLKSHRSFYWRNDVHVSAKFSPHKNDTDLPINPAKIKYEPVNSNYVVKTWVIIVVISVDYLNSYENKASKFLA